MLHKAAFGALCLLGLIFLHVAGFDLRAGKWKNEIVVGDRLEIGAFDLPIAKLKASIVDMAMPGDYAIAVIEVLGHAREHLADAELQIGLVASAPCSAQSCL